MDASFQLGLELTNLLNPVGQAVSALRSLGVQDAFRKSGSDYLVELRLASFIGRHRIDEAIKIHFREAVAKAEHSPISRFMDIILEAGAGPTVQEALKNPALFSMIIQLSALAFSHQDESLANAIVEAMDRITQSSKRDIDAVPDYVSLLGTLKACQQQTASFQWAPIYESVERKILATLKHVEQDGINASRGRKRRKVGHKLNTKPNSVMNRQLPFAILQSLFMGIQPLQSLGEHRELHIKANSGISTIVVWCRNVLGLGVTVRSQNVDVHFGNEPGNVTVEDCAAEDVSATMLDLADPHEPLFRLHSDEDDPSICHEHRFHALGFGRSVLMQVTTDDAALSQCSYWIIARALEINRQCLLSSEVFDAAVEGDDETDDLGEHAVKPLSIQGIKSLYSHQSSSEVVLINAARIVFALDKVDTTILRQYENLSPKKPSILSQLNWPALVAVVIALSRVHPADLDNCGNLPFSLRAFERLKKTHHGVSHNVREKVNAIETIRTSFQVLCHLMLNTTFTEDYVRHAVLVSAWGWSIFFETVDALDPAEASAYSIRLLQGVPSRKGVRRARIIDGPTTLIRLSKGQTLWNKPEVVYFPGVSTARRGDVLVGQQSDAFEVTQSFVWNSAGDEHTALTARKRKLGFRTMLELCAGADRLPHCNCDRKDLDFSTWLERYALWDSTHKHHEWERPVSYLSSKNCEFAIFSPWPKAQSLPSQLQERVFHRIMANRFKCVNGGSHAHAPIQLESRGDMIAGRNPDPSVKRNELEIPLEAHKWFFYVSDNPAARWLQLDDLYHSCQDDFRILIRTKDTCIECAVKSELVEHLKQSLVLL